ncbi:hypothetical protein BH11GEM2_BH11GEM2_36220 [soil metagenome]
MPSPKIASEIARYLRTGDADIDARAWPGDIFERGKRQHADLHEALVREVRRLSSGRAHAPVPANVGIEFTRAKVEPMVRGLFRRDEQELVLATLEKSVVYVTTETIESILWNERWERSAWDLANMYLLSVGAKLLGKKAARIVGMSEETTCYVAADYFTEDDLFADFIVHEAAHIFHNCKRRTVGLHETRRKEWLLDIEFTKRETFAYSCEAYARIVERAKSRTERLDLAAEYGSKRRISADRVDPKEVASIVAEAANARNGWRTILARCAPIVRPRTIAQVIRDLNANASTTEGV